MAALFAAPRETRYDVTEGIVPSNARLSRADASSVRSSRARRSNATTALAATPDGGFVAAVSWHDRVKFGEVEVAAKGYDLSLIHISEPTRPY